MQVSLYLSEDPDKHYRLGQAVSALRDEGIVIIGAGMSVHNLRDMMLTRGDPTPMPTERQVRMAEAVKRPDARQAHPVRSQGMRIWRLEGSALTFSLSSEWTT